MLFGLQQGTRVLRDIHAEMGGLDHVEKLMGDSADAVAYQQEVSDMLGGRITNQDEDEVEDELAALEAEVHGGAAAATAPRRPQHVSTPAILPTAPDRPLPEEVEENAPSEQQQPRKAKAEPERRAMLAS